MRYYDKHRELINERKRNAPRTDVERAYARAYYAKHRDRIRSAALRREAQLDPQEVKQRKREWVAKDRLNRRAIYLLASAKKRAKENGWDFALRLSDIVIPSHCPVFGVPLEIVVGKGQQRYAPSLDRIDSGKGYTPENVRVISLRANRAKFDLTLAEAELIVKNWFAR